MQGGSRDAFNWGPAGFGGDTGRTRARREKQDEYRKALDAQIEERRARDRTRRGSSNQNSQSVPEKAVSDPVGHLMHWVNKDGLSKGPSENNQKSHPNPTEQSSHHQLQPQLQYHHPQQPQQQSYSYGTPEGTSFYGPLPPPPAAFQNPPQLPPPVMQQQQQQPAHPPQNYQAQHLYQSQFHPQQNVAYGYYPSSQPVGIPPPPTYTPSTYHTYGSPPQMAPQQHQPQQHQQHQQLQYHHPIPPPPAAFGIDSQDAPQNSPAVERAHETEYTYTPSASDKKPHASQCYEDTPAAQENEKDKLEEYRLTLEMQLEQKKRIEEERLANEKKLDDMLRKRDEMILKREKEGMELEKRRIMEKQAEQLRKAEEAAKGIEEQMKIAKRMKEAKLEAKRKEVERMLENLPQPEERASPKSISKRADVVYDNTPVPALMNRKSTELEGKGIDLGGSGDNNMSIIGTFQSNGNGDNNNNNGNPAHRGPAGGFRKKKYVEDAGHVNLNEDIQQQKVKPVEMSSYGAPPETPEPINEAPKAVSPEPPRRLRSETYRLRNAHTSIIGPNGQVQETYMYVPTSPVHLNKYRSKGQQKPSTANNLPEAHTPAREAASYSSLPSDYQCRTCPNCRHAFSGNLVIETKDESTETDQSEPPIPHKYPDKQLQDQDREFLAKLQSFFKDESAQIKEEMNVTDEEIFECDNNLIPMLSFDDPPVTPHDLN